MISDMHYNPYNFFVILKLREGGRRNVERKKRERERQGKCTGEREWGRGCWWRKLGLFGLEKRKLREDVISLRSLKGGYSKVEVSLFTQVTVVGWEGMAWSCAKGVSSWILEKNVFSQRVVVHWYRLRGEVVESLSLEVFENHGDSALRGMA